MSANLLRENPPLGDIVYQWTVREYEKHERGRRWYVVFGVLTAVLLLSAVLSGNYLFALVVVLFGIILFLQNMQRPMELPFAITETGIVIGNKYYSFSELTSYWIIYQPPDVKNLYFMTNNMLRHRLQVPLADNDPRPIREFLNKFVVEDLEQEEEPLSDRLARILKLH